MARELKGAFVSYGGVRLIWSPGDGPGRYVTGFIVRIDHPSNKSLHGKWVRLDMDPKLAREVSQQLSQAATDVERHQSALEESHKDA